MIEYLFSMVFELYIPCYYCTLVSSISENLPISIYNSNWLWQSLKFKRILKIMMLRSLKRERAIVSGGLFEVGLPTFLSVGKQQCIFLGNLLINVLILCFLYIYIDIACCIFFINIFEKFRLILMNIIIISNKQCSRYIRSYKRNKYVKEILRLNKVPLMNFTF